MNVKQSWLRTTKNINIHIAHEPQTHPFWDQASAPFSNGASTAHRSDPGGGWRWPSSPWPSERSRCCKAAHLPRPSIWLWTRGVWFHSSRYRRPTTACPWRPPARQRQMLPSPLGQRRLWDCGKASGVEPITKVSGLLLFLRVSAPSTSPPDFIVRAKNRSWGGQRAIFWILCSVWRQNNLTCTNQPTCRCSSCIRGELVLKELIIREIPDSCSFWMSSFCRSDYSFSNSAFVVPIIHSGIRTFRLFEEHSNHKFKGT